MCEERELWRGFHEHDAQAYVILWSRNQSRLMGVAMTLCRGKQSHAEECMGELAVQLSKPETQDRYNPEISPWYIYARVVLIHICINHYRHEARRTHLSLDSDDDGNMARVLESREPAPHRSAQLHETQTIIGEALAQLPETSRDVLVDQYWDGCTQRDSAKRRGVPKGTISTRRISAMQILRNRLEARIERGDL
jgi:RNA polymerase sigma factor (sigma-70 family)